MTAAPAPNRALLAMFTVYESPRDYPGLFVARRWEIAPGIARPTAWVRTADTLDAVRALLPAGLCRIDRTPDDDPAIAEVWV